MDITALYAQVVVDRVELLRVIRQSLQARSQISLGEILTAHPLRQGLAELVAYMQLACDWPHAIVDESTLETVEWHMPDAPVQRARLPRIIFVRK